MKKAKFRVKLHPSLLAGEHNYLCAVCHELPAVYQINDGILQPCWKCQRKGYEIIKRKKFLWFKI